jgi:hypothetical protein
MEIAIWVVGFITGISMGAIMSANDDKRKAPFIWYIGWFLGLFIFGRLIV